MNGDGTGDSMGLLAWATGSMNDYFSDDNARSLLGGLTTRGLMNDNRWDSIIASAVLANLRTHG